MLGFLLVVLAAFGLSVLGGTLMVMYRGDRTVASLSWVLFCSWSLAVCPEG